MSAYDDWKTTQPTEIDNLYSDPPDDLYGDHEGRCTDTFAAHPRHGMIRGICTGCELPVDICECGDQPE